VSAVDAECDWRARENRSYPPPRSGAEICGATWGGEEPQVCIEQAPGAWEITGPDIHPIPDFFVATESVDIQSLLPMPPGSIHRIDPEADRRAWFEQADWRREYMRDFAAFSPGPEIGTTAWQRRERERILRYERLHQQALAENPDLAAEEAVSQAEAGPRPLPEAYDPRPDPRDAKRAGSCEDWIKRSAAIIEECQRERGQ